jgi:uncharacterized protein (TIGR02266 family)
LADPNTRQGKRTPVTLKIKFKSETLEQFIERYAVDVSQGGIFIRTKEPLAVGTQMKFEFQLRDASPLIAGEGTVVWTRENDPSRPAIAPGMGVRFDRLGDGSQNVLEKILAEKAKQAPQRGNDSVTKPPMFTDTPTRVAAAPLQDQLSGGRKRADSQETPLPKPVPFHSDADEFGAEAFEEATKVRTLEELVAQTAADAGQDPQQVVDQLSGKNADRDSAPALPSAPEPSGRTAKLLDTSPSPRDEQAPMRTSSPSLAPLAPPAASATAHQTRPGVEPAKAAIRLKDTGERARPVSVAPESNLRTGSPSRAPIVIGILFTLAAAAAAVWYFVLRNNVADVVAKQPVAVAPADAPGVMTGSAGSATAMVGSGVATGSDGSNVAVAVASGPVSETEIASNVAQATVTVVDAAQGGPAPFKAKLVKDKAYKVRVEAPGYAVKELDVKGGQDKVTATLTAKPRIVSVTSDPVGGMIYVDNAPTGKKTPADIELTAAQAARKQVHVQVRLAGYKAADQLVDQTTLKDAGDKMTASLDAKLAVAPVVVQPPRPPHPDGAGTGSAVTPDGAGSASAGSASAGSAAVPEKAPAPAPAPIDKPAGGEPEPDWSKNKTP